MNKFETSDLAVHSRPLVVNENAYEITRGDVIMGRVKATYDFSELPKRYHQIVLMMLQKSWTIRDCI